MGVLASLLVLGPRLLVPGHPAARLGAAWPPGGGRPAQSRPASAAPLQPPPPPLARLTTKLSGTTMALRPTAGTNVLYSCTRARGAWGGVGYGGGAGRERGRKPWGLAEDEGTASPGPGPQERRPAPASTPASDSLLRRQRAARPGGRRAAAAATGRPRWRGEGAARTLQPGWAAASAAWPHSSAAASSRDRILMIAYLYVDWPRPGARIGCSPKSWAKADRHQRGTDSRAPTDGSQAVMI